MSIDPEKLLDLAKRRHHDGGVTLGWPMVVNIVDELRKLQALRQKLLDERNQVLRERDQLKALAAERAQFILNAVELGYCQLPDSDTPDSAHGTYERCKLTGSEAIAHRDAALLDRLARALNEDHLEYDAIAPDAAANWLHDQADEFRRRAEEAPCSPT